MKNLKKHLSLFICIMLCMTMLPAGILSAQAASAPVVTVDGYIATLDYNGAEQVNKIYVGYMGTTDPGNISTWGDYSAKKLSHNCIQKPVDGSNYVLKNVGYYTILVNYNVGTYDYDVYFNIYNATAAGASAGKPVMSNSVASNKAVIDFNGAYKVNKVHYGFLGSEPGEYTNYSDFVATVSDRMIASSLTDGQAIELAKVGYYRFIVNYTDGYRDYDAVYTLKNEIAGSIQGMPSVTTDGYVATLGYNGASAVNKIYVGYMGNENPGDVKDWATYQAKVQKNSCTMAPADGAQFVLRDAGYYVFLVNYASGSSSVDTYYSAYVAQGVPEGYKVPFVSAVAGTNEVVFAQNGATTINKVFYGYIGETAPEYVDYYDYVAKAVDKVIDASATDGKKYGMSKVGYYRFIISYNNGGKDADAVYTIENTVAGKVAGIPAITENAGIVTLDYNDAGSVEKMYVGYMGTENPGTVNDWATYTAKRQSNICVTSPADAYQYFVKGEAGFYTFVINYTTNGVNADTYYTIEIREVLSETYGKPSVTQIVEGSNDVEFALNNAFKVNKVYYGYLGEENYDYVDYYDYVAKATDRKIDAEPTDGKVYRLGAAGYYRFIINYSDANSKTYDAVYTVCVDVEDPVTVSNDIYDNLEYIISDMEELEECDLLNLDAKGQEIYDMLKVAVNEVFALKDEGFMVSKAYVRETYSSEIADIADIVDSMTAEERAAFEYEMGKFNPTPANALINLFDININYGE